MRIPKYYHNLPERFIKRNTTFIEKIAPNLPQYQQKVFNYKNEPYYDRWRPWEDEFQRLNHRSSKIRKIFVEPIKHWPFFRGDRIEVIRGEDQGKQGIVNYIVRERNWLFAQGIRVKRELTEGVVIAREEPLLANFEAKLVDPTDLMPTDIEWRYDDDGNRQRVSKRTERIIPIPKSAYETMDYVEKHAYSEQPKDTPAELVNKVTFKPQVKTFEMDICDQQEIKEDRIPYPMYWY